MAQANQCGLENKAQVVSLENKAQITECGAKGFRWKRF